MKKIISFIIIVLTVSGLGGCKKNNASEQVTAGTPEQTVSEQVTTDTPDRTVAEQATADATEQTLHEQIVLDTPEQAVDQYLKDIQQNPVKYIDSWIDPNYCQEIAPLLSEFEYELGETSEAETDPDLGECAAVMVSFTGYDIYTYYAEFLENISNEMPPAILAKYSFHDLVGMMNDSEESFQKLYNETALEVFHQYMEECREAGKTYHTEMGQYGIRVYKDAETNEWAPNPSVSQIHVDWITNRLYGLHVRLDGDEQDFTNYYHRNHDQINVSGQLSDHDYLSAFIEFIRPARDVQFSNDEPINDPGYDLKDVDVFHIDGLILYVPKELQMRETPDEDYSLSNIGILDNMCFIYDKHPLSDLDVEREIFKSDNDLGDWMSVKTADGTVGEINGKYYNYGPLGSKSFSVDTYLITEDHFYNVCYYCDIRVKDDYQELMARMLNWIEIDPEFAENQ